MVDLFLTLLLTFKAHSAVIEYPAHCLRSLPKSCAFRFINQEKLLHQGAEIHALSGTTLLYRKGVGYSLLDGKALLLTKKPWHLYHLGHSIEIEGEVFLENEHENRLKVTNLNAKVQFLAGKHREALLPGFENWYAFLNGSPSQGYFRAFDAVRVFSLLNKIWEAPVSFKKQHWAHYRALWRSRVELSASFYREVANEIEQKANHKRQNEERKLSEAKQEDENLRKLFREKNFLE